MTESFDLRNVVLDRPQPMASFKIWFTEAPFFKIARLTEKHADAKPGAEVEELDRLLEEAEKEKDALAFTIYITAITSRKKEDLFSKAMAEFPIKRDEYGLEDMEQARKRLRYEQELAMRAQIVKIVDPQGRERIINEDDEGLIQVRSILDGAPEVTVKQVNSAMLQISGKAEMDKYARMDLDFLSGN